MISGVEPASQWSVRSATEEDLPATLRLGATCFGSYTHPETVAAWRSLVPVGGALVACDGTEIVGMASYLDLQLTVPGGAVVPAAGLTAVAVAPTHRRQGLLRAMSTELHNHIAASQYPIAALTASEGGIYGRFGYGPSTIECAVVVERRFARFHSDAPSGGRVRLVQPSDHRDEFMDIYDRWRLRTPGGLACPAPLWDDLLADREEDRDGGTAWFAFLHPDGYALYRVHDGESMIARVEGLIAATPEAHAALWRALVGLDLMSRVEIDTHDADPLPYLLTDSRVAKTTSKVDSLWLRIMDVAAALEARQYLSDVTAVLDVSDEFRRDGGRFVFDVRDGKARCSRTDTQAQVHLSMSALGSIFLGSHRVAALAAANRIRCHDSRLLADLDAAFRSAVPAEIGYRF